MSWLSRFFGGNNNIIKDPELGKVRYIESDNGHSWGGTVRSAFNGANVSYYIESPEKVLKHEPKNRLLDTLELEGELRDLVQVYVTKNVFPFDASDFIVQFIYIAQVPDQFDAQWICAAGETSFSVMFQGDAVTDLIVHDA